jgi:hypothetical protein
VLSRFFSFNKICGLYFPEAVCCQFGNVTFQYNIVPMETTTRVTNTRMTACRVALWVCTGLAYNFWWALYLGATHSQDTPQLYLSEDGSRSKDALLTWPWWSCCCRESRSKILRGVTMQPVHNLRAAWLPMHTPGFHAQHSVLLPSSQSREVEREKRI